MEEPRWLAVIAKTPADARDYLIEGKAGFLRVIRPEERPLYEPSKRRLTWPNGSWATIYSAEEPDQLRGFSGDTAILDEFAKWERPQLCWDNLAFGMRERSKDRPRRVIATTPRPLEILRKIEQLRGTFVTTGTSYENRRNLDETWYADTITPYEGTRIGRQEILAEYVEEVVGALFPLDMMERVRVRPEDCPPFTTTVVSIDPAGTRDEDKDAPDKRPKNDEIGIVVASLGTDNRVYLREDLSIAGSPELWGKRAIAAYHHYQADHIVAEQNYGGDMVSYVIRSIDENAPVKVVTASRAKHIRAEPVAALYDSKRDAIRHVGSFPQLEAQLALFTTLGYEGSRSPDRADAWIWAVTDLALGSGAFSWIEYYRRLGQQQADEEKRNPGPKFNFSFGVKNAKIDRVRIRVPEGISVYYGRDGTKYNISAERVIEISAEDATSVTALGWEKVA